jgi:hypothetical protein
MVDETPSTHKADRNRVPSQITLLDGGPARGAANVFCDLAYPRSTTTSSRVAQRTESLTHPVILSAHRVLPGGSAIQIRISYWR